MKRLCSIRTEFLIVLGVTLVVSLYAPLGVSAQTEDSFGDAAADPVRLFEQGQNAHAQGNFERALEFYERAIRIRPEFPEAEFQRGNALVSLGRLSTAHLAFERAIELRKTWSLPYSARGALFVREGKDLEAEKSFRRALALDRHDNVALRMLAEIRLRANDAAEALGLSQQATREPETPMGTWIVRAMAERAIGDKKAAHTSLEKVFQLEPENLAALLERAELWIAEADYERAASDLTRALNSSPEDKLILRRLVFVYERAGKTEDAQRLAKRAGLVQAQPVSDGTIKVIGTSEEIETANSEDPGKSRAALEKLLQKNPENAVLYARLGASYRTDNPTRALEYYRRAVEIQPGNADYATGYAAALIQSRRFADAVTILRRVVTKFPEHYTARANLATALYELKRYPEALSEHHWLLRARPDLAVTHYFIATAHDYLGEYPEALKAYEAFLNQAEARTNELEIEKVKLRLPSLRKQIQLGEGVKRKN